MEFAPRVGLQISREWDSFLGTTRFQYLYYGKLLFPDPFPRFESYSLKSNNKDKTRNCPGFILFGSGSWTMFEPLSGREVVFTPHPSHYSLGEMKSPGSAGAREK